MSFKPKEALLTGNYKKWLDKNDADRKTWLQEQKDNYNLIYENEEFTRKWDKFVNGMNNDCIEFRLKEYPSIHDLTVAQYEGDAREMHDKRDAVRNKYPKVIDTTE